MSATSKALAASAKGKSKTAGKQEARVPVKTMRDRMRKASAPDPIPEAATPAATSAPAPWDDTPATTEKNMSSSTSQVSASISGILGTLAELGIKPAVEQPAPVPETATPMSTSMPEIVHTAAAPVQQEPAASGIENHPLFANTPKPIFQPQTQAPAPVGFSGNAYAGFDTPLGQSYGAPTPSKDKKAPHKSTAVYASNTDRL